MIMVIKKCIFFRKAQFVNERLQSVSFSNYKCSYIYHPHLRPLSPSAVVKRLAYPQKGLA